MRQNKHIIFTKICIVLIVTFLCNISAKAQDNYFSEIIEILTEQKLIAEGCVNSINTKYYEKSIDLETYNNAKHLYLLASGSFNGLISRLISDVESSNKIYRADYINDINRAKERSNNFILFVNEFYRGSPFIKFLNNFSTFSICLDAISNFIFTKKIDKEKLIRDLNSLKWRSFSELSIS